MPLNADYRPMYKIGLIIIILQKVTIGNKSSLNKLHFFIWALKSTKNMEFIKSVIESGNTSEIITWGVEPALNKALNFGVYEELFVLKDDKPDETQTTLCFCSSHLLCFDPREFGDPLRRAGYHSVASVSIVAQEIFVVAWN